MTEVLVCTAAYEAGRPFLPQYIQALGRAAAGRDVAALLAIDDLMEPEAAFAPLSRLMETRFAEAPAGSTPAAVRTTMLEAARRSEADILVLVDLDDLPAPDAIDRHRAALAESEISYGDLRVVDADGQTALESFFDDAGVPDSIGGPDALAMRNFVGFSNAAVRRESIVEAAVAIPPHLVAADWWFFTTLVEAGARARRAEGVVADYRLHAANALGGRPDPALPAVLRRARMMRDHYAALSTSPTRAAADRRVAELLRAAARDPERVAWLAQAACAACGVWFDDVTRLAKTLANEASAIRRRSPRCRD